MKTFEIAQAKHARAAGWMLIAMTFTGIGAEFFARVGLYVPGDITATVSNMQAAHWKYIFGFLCYSATFILDVLVAVHLYRLFEAQDKTRALLALTFRLVYTGVVIALLFLYVASGLFLFTDMVASWQTQTEVHQQVYLTMSLFGESFVFALIFFGMHLVYLGLLVAKSEVLPKWLGILIFLGGLSYSLNGVLHFIMEHVPELLTGLFGLLGMAEVVLAIYLVIKSKSKVATS